MGHGVPIATTGPDAYGTAGPFFLDAGVSATARIARFWGLESQNIEHLASAELFYRPETVAPARYTTPSRWRFHGAEEETGQADPTTSSIFNPKEVIAAAFKAAGLPQPIKRDGSDTGKVDPDAIIAAALKAAGLAGH
jgi:hypothetical protein